MLTPLSHEWHSTARGGPPTDAEWGARWRGHGIRVPQSRLASEAAKLAKGP